jgi:hypothetical protein
MAQFQPWHGQPEGHVGLTLDVVAALKGTPLEGAARPLLHRLEATLAASGGPAFHRMRIAILLGDFDAAATILAEELRSATPSEVLTLTLEAEALLRIRPDAGLLEAGTARLLALSADSDESEELSARLKTWARLQAGAGHLESALDLARPTLDGAEGPGILARLGCWEALEDSLGPPREGESARVLGWRFQASLGLGRLPEAQEGLLAWAREAVQGDGTPVLLPGASRFTGALQARPELARALEARFDENVSGTDPFLAREPWRRVCAL